MLRTLARPFIGLIAFVSLLSAINLPASASQRTSPRAFLNEQIRKKAEIDYPQLSTQPSFANVLTAIERLDRRAFVPARQRAKAYLPEPLPIGYGQTISDPYVVAIMTWAVGAGRGSNVLEVGTGSGYQAGVLSKLGATVHSVEIVPQLAKAAAKRLREMGLANVTVKAGDGFAGWPEFAPYDGIIVTAGSSAVPAPLLNQLRVGGKLVMPIGANAVVEQLVVIEKSTDGMLVKCSLGPAMFVPLTGEHQMVDRPGLYDRSIPLCRRGQTAKWPGQPGG